MDKLQAILQIVISNTFIMYFKAHSYHWNVEGKDFSQLHGFFGGIYEEVFESIDAAAEELRVLDVYAPFSLMNLYEHKTLQEDSAKPSTSVDMLKNLQEANDKVIESLNKLFDTATAEKKQGLADFAAGRLDVHNKHGWMIRSHLKGQ